MTWILSESYFTGEEMEAIKLWPVPEKAEINLIFLSSQGPQREQDWIFLCQEPMAILSTGRTAKNSTIFWLCFQRIHHSTFQSLANSANKNGPNFYIRLISHQQISFAFHQVLPDLPQTQLRFHPGNGGKTLRAPEQVQNVCCAKQV